MTNIRLSGDCGNSPKNRLIQEFTLAIARADAGRIEELATRDIQWLSVGRKPILGAQSVCRALTRLGPATSIDVHHVISHGRSGAVDGTVAFGGKRRGFCHVFTFGSAKGTNVSAITTYSIAID